MKNVLSGLFRVRLAKYPSLLPSASALSTPAYLRQLFVGQQIDVSGAWRTQESGLNGGAQLLAAMTDPLLYLNNNNYHYCYYNNDYNYNNNSNNGNNNYVNRHQIKH